ncbi:DNA cytosine methyltransferase [Sinosporangium siamense]|uniref:DNA cytosine methyltransferase n=1 Tax=Sinosporangium siamense TaxID=1367973 RepID=UPI0035EF7BED
MWLLHSHGRGHPRRPRRPDERRLTPRERELLQDYPDHWPLPSGDCPHADSPRHRRLGISVAVPVVEWIARRLVDVDATRARESTTVLPPGGFEKERQWTTATPSPACVRTSASPSRFQAGAV